MLQEMKLKDLVPNTGQMAEQGLPINPRCWSDDDVERLARSLAETPELLEARPIIAVPYNSKYLVLGGNMRLEALKRIKSPTAPVHIFEDISIDKMREIVIKDNGSFGAWDWENLANEWDDLPLKDWGVPKVDFVEEPLEDEEREGANYETPKLTIELTQDEFAFVVAELAKVNANQKKALLEILHYEEDSTKE